MKNALNIHLTLLVFFFFFINTHALILKARPVNFWPRFGRLDAGRLALLVSTC